ncbi:hypothetical protein V5799_018090 [Amblyomma americanum]|uniref:Uncharacterized protein n=1 Tax=Amblyomma americanum TaxID=6943 RepID=A0AAQ4F1H4_AMBAM
MLEELEQGAIGDPRYEHVTLGLPTHGLQRVFCKDLGGSVVLTMGTYCAQLALQVVGPEPPVRIAASGDFTSEGSVDVPQYLKCERHATTLHTELAACG